MIKFSIIIHLGKNPRNGGRPPNESRLIIKQNFIKGKLDLNKKI